MTRRSCGALLLLALLVLLHIGSAQGTATASAQTTAGQAVTQTEATQKRITPAIALQMLKDGNARFTSGTMFKRNLMEQVKTTGGGQYPFAQVVSCMDSRTAPEFLFDQGIGDIFSPRIAGNFVNDDIIGSLEFGSKLAGSHLIVVLGHTRCGAIRGACDNAQLGLLTETLKRIKPAIDAVPNDGSPRASSNAAFVQKVADMNVRLAVKQISDRSAVLREMVTDNKLLIVGAMYDVSTGKVTFY